MIPPSSIIATLAARRREMGMSYALLAARAGLSLSTVRRVLRGAGNVRFAAVCAVAAALGVEIHLRSRPIQAVRREQARCKAAEIVRFTQGSFALEGQAVDEATVRRVARQIERRLLAGPPIALWS